MKAKLAKLLLNLRVQFSECSGAKRKFLASIVISYIGALIIGVLGALMSPSCDFNNGIYSFGACNENLYVSVFLLLNASEVLAPTTITFSGTILLLQSKKESVMRSTFLWLIMLALVGLSICLQQISDRIALTVMATIIVVLSIVSILFAWSISDTAQIKLVHKREISDGRMTF